MITIEPPKQKINVDVLISSSDSIPVSPNVPIMSFIIIASCSNLLSFCYQVTLVYYYLEILSSFTGKMFSYPWHFWIDNYFVVCSSIWVCLFSHDLIQIHSSSCVSLTQYDWPPSPRTLPSPCLVSDAMPGFSSAELHSSPCWYSNSQYQIAPMRMSSSAYWDSDICASQHHCTDVPLLPCSKPLYSSLPKTNVYFAPLTLGYNYSGRKEKCNQHFE